MLRSVFSTIIHECNLLYNENIIPNLFVEIKENRKKLRKSCENRQNAVIVIENVEKGETDVGTVQNSISRGRS